ncbi:MAG: DUF349 domain-containing protein [Paludibacteraceae bacterium]|nr:DUF349 domain-containing protein [Paludibacteraceae bacterium]
MDVQEIITEQTFDPQQLATLNREELVNTLKEIVENGEITAIKEQVDCIKQLFYKRQQQERAEAMNSVAEEVENEEVAAEPKQKQADPVEAEFKAVMGIYRDKKAAYIAAIEAEQAANLDKKRAILEKLKALVGNEGEIKDTIAAFRQLQSEWREIGPVAPAYVNDIWREYNLYQEQIYDLIKIDAELREYAFKKNLEDKTRLIEQAEKLNDEEDVVKSFRLLQVLHDQWREIGPVARELREEIWNRFKEASSAVNRRHQAFFEAIKNREQEIEKERTEVIEFIENIDTAAITTYKEWDEKTQEVIALNEKFRSDDPTERRVINRLFKRYRSACDRFFEAKNEYYRRIKEELQANLEKKRLLVEKAEQLKNSEEWRSTTDKLIALQKEWKTIGPTAKKYSDAIWARFIAACDHFFARKEENFKGKKTEEQENLRLKLEAIEAIKAYELTGNDDEDNSALRRLSDAYSVIGHVPFKEKDRIYKLYKEALNEKTSKIRSRRRTAELAFNGDRNKLFRQYESLKQQIATYENNICFFNSSSKKGNKMVEELERKIQNLRQDLAIIIDQINKLED